MLAVLITLFVISEFTTAQLIQSSLQSSNRFNIAEATTFPLLIESGIQSAPISNYKKIFDLSAGNDGRYRPEIYNKNVGNNGKYRPDDSGKYIHRHVPYDGGYGDKGAIGGKYTHNDPGYKTFVDKLISDGGYTHDDSGYKDNTDAFNYQSTNGNSNAAISNKRDDSEKDNSKGEKKQTKNSNGKIYTQFPSSGFGDLKKPISKNISTHSDSIFDSEKNNEITNILPSFNSIREITDDNDESVNKNIDQQSRTKYMPSSNRVNYGGWRIIRDNRGYSPPYHYLYETENKILAEETGRLHNMGNDNGNIKAFGFYEYYGDDGQKYHIDYTADEYGYIPKGNHIHKAIQKALEYQLKLAKNQQQ